VLRALGALLPGMAFGLVAWRVGQPLAVLLAVGLFVYLLRRLPTAPPAAGSP
jgi:hypothetical protein